MAKGFYISKTLGIVGVVLGTGAVATIIALSVVYSQEKSRNNEIEVKPTEGTTTTTYPTTNLPTTPGSNAPWDSFRLPDTLIPESYDVMLWPRLKPNDLGLYIFTGNSSVVFRCVKETDLILIHANKLVLFTTPSLSSLNGSPAPTITSERTVNRTQYFVFHLSEKLKAGELYRLHTEFWGELADDLGGFYRSEYEFNNVKKVVATTQMQPTDARKAFPCFDEPAMKAYFNITLLHEPGTIALSNGQEIDSFEVVEAGEKLNKTRFETTRKMSTYLLAFIVSDFKAIEDMEGDILIRIFAREEAIDAGHGQYALNITGKILKFFENYYNAPYPLSKSDQVALPDFNAGAMENWGLITYRETALLYDPEVSSNGNKERVATIIAHELAHMWFGNLVTIRWWNDLWLNEGFASYVEYLGADNAEPDWNIGASVLRMLSDFLNETVFVQGLSSYLNHFQFDNTVYTDLWDHLQRAVNATGTQLPESVSDIMDRWVLQMGFPVVTVDTVTGKISQKHFLLNPDSIVERPSPFSYEWIVPIQWMKNGDKQKIHWLMTKESQNDMMKMVGSDWLVVNLDVVGYYRVNYDMGNWRKLLEKLQTSHQSIRVINRAQIIDDAFNLARIHPNLRSTVYCRAIAAGGVAEWDFAWAEFKKATIATEAEKLRAAMACSTTPWILNRYLSYTLDPSKIRKQDATSTIIYVANNVVGQPLAWDFIRANWECPFSTMCIICTVVSVASVCVIVGLWTFQFLSFSDQTRSPTRSDGHRLPECSHPISYSVTLGLRLEPNVFTGNSSVMFECVKETDLLLIHSNKLKKITEVTLNTLTGAPAPVITSISSTNQTLRLALKEKLKAGERYKLHVTGDPRENQQTTHSGEWADMWHGQRVSGEWWSDMGQRVSGRVGQVSMGRGSVESGQRVSGEWADMGRGSWRVSQRVVRYGQAVEGQWRVSEWADMGRGSVESGRWQWADWEMGRYGQRWESVESRSEWVADMGRGSVESGQIWAEGQWRVVRGSVESGQIWQGVRGSVESGQIWAEGQWRVGRGSVESGQRVSGEWADMGRGSVESGQRVSGEWADMGRGSVESGQIWAEGGQGQ
ncbi:Aminopeptidase N [Bagarius yarrelli]|uniref:Aminopeptidase N n=1 Tax=Bagarius yarrelli TaxID=175774 RepID=A0A556VC73_BAGYA|nr:Aminopeptidase N [Bagarius yarrelli]